MPVSSIITTHIAVRISDDNALCGKQMPVLVASTQDVQQGRFYANYCNNCFNEYWIHHHDGRDGSEKD